MVALWVYFGLAVGVSFLCSLCEAALLTLSPADAEILAKRSPKAGARLKRMKRSIDRPLAAVLTLNTISHTIWAAGVGAQSIAVFGERWIGLTSAVLTFVILIASEIIPKTVGAINARRIAVPMVYTVLVMIVVTYPIVVMLDLVGRVFKAGAHAAGPSREELVVAAELARVGGAITAGEGQLVENMLRLRERTVEDVMTPRKVMFSLSAGSTPDEVVREHPSLRFSRIPLRDAEDPEKILGLVLRHDIQRAVIEKRGATPLARMKRRITYVPETATLTRVLEAFGGSGHHLFGVADEHGSVVGIITLEDVVETILGREIVDETDPIADMRELASQ